MTTGYFMQKDYWQNKTHKRLFYSCLICLSLYLSYVLCFSDSAFLLSTPKVVFCILFLVIAAGLFGIMLAACRFFRQKEFVVQMKNEKMNPGFFVICFIVSAAILFWVQACIGPWGESPDTLTQWEQVLTGNYDDWHPVFHTLLLAAIHRIFGDYIWVIICQIVAFAAAYAYLLTVVKACGVSKWILIMLDIITCLSPAVSTIMIYAWKDNSMTIGVLCLLGYAIQTVRTKGEWANSPLHLILLGMMLAFTTLVRKNGFFFTLPLIGILLLVYKAQVKKMFWAVVVMVAMIALITGPLYTKLEVSYPDNTLNESIGVPMTVLCEVKMVAPEELGDETAAFLDEAIPEEAWERYKLHDYNNIKWFSPYPSELGLTWEKIFRMMVDTMISATSESIVAFNGLTDLVWGIQNKQEMMDYVPSPHLGGMDIDPFVRHVLEEIQGWNKTVFSWLLDNIGPSLAILLVVTLIALYIHGASSLLFTVPILFYDLGTMLLLCGNDGRFFQFSPIASLALILLLIPRRQISMKR